MEFVLSEYEIITSKNKIGIGFLLHEDEDKQFCDVILNVKY